MSFMIELADTFDKEFAFFEANRMYPPDYRKESAVTKLTLDHVGAIEHGTLALLKTIDGPRNSPINQKIDCDIARFEELRWHVLNTIYNPGLPLGPENQES